MEAKMILKKQFRAKRRKEVWLRAVKQLVGGNIGLEKKLTDLYK